MPPPPPPPGIKWFKTIYLIFYYFHSSKEGFVLFQEQQMHTHTLLEFDRKLAFSDRATSQYISATASVQNILVHFLDGIQQIG